MARIFLVNPTSPVNTEQLQDWDSAKRVLSRNSFMDELRNYDKESLTTERRKSLKRYVDDENMSVDRLRKVSHSLEWKKALEGLIFASVGSQKLGTMKTKLHSRSYANAQWSPAIEPYTEYCSRGHCFGLVSVSNVTIVLSSFVVNQILPLNGCQVSLAAAGMCMWVHAMDQYADIFEEVKPRMDTVQVFTLC